MAMKNPMLEDASALRRFRAENACLCSAVWAWIPGPEKGMMTMSLGKHEIQGNS